MASVLGILFGIFAAYRIFGVYSWRAGECLVPSPQKTVALPESLVNRDLTILTFNIEGHAVLIRNDHLEKIAKLIRESNADIVGLQEVHRGTWQARFRDQPAELARLTGMHVFFGSSFRALGGEFGNAVLTRGTFVEKEAVALPSFGEPRSVTRTVIDLGGGTRIDFLVSHLATWGKFNRTARRKQIDCISSLVSRSRYPVVLVGDFNATPVDPEIRALSTLKHLALLGDPEEATHKLTLQHLDYIYADRRLVPTHAGVVKGGPSDHWAVIARFDARSGPRAQ